VTLPESVKLKLDWADEHVKTLKKAHDEFFATDPYTYRKVIEGGTEKKEGTDHVFLWEKFTPIPNNFGLIVGDAVHNARAALDHLAFALAKQGAASKGVTMTPEEETGIQFPIVTTNTKFKNQIGKGRLKYVVPDARALIKARQPYSLVPGNPEITPLFRVSQFDNTDKHRTINVTIHAISIIQTSWPTDLRDTPFQPPTDYWRQEPGTEIGRFVFATPQSEMDVPTELRFGCVLPDVPPLWSIWYQVEEWVRNLRFIAGEIADRFLP
jgi:hypothetical protein